MNLQSLIPYIPFLSVLYAMFAFVQSLRHKQQGITALLLALVSIAAPFIAYIFTSDTAARASLLQAIAINAAVVFVASLLTLFIERRNSKRNRNRSYGMLGLGLSLLLAVSMFTLPVFSSSTSNTTAAGTNATNAANQSGLVLVSAQMPAASINQTGSAAAEVTPNADTTPVAPSGQAPNGNFPPPNGQPGGAMPAAANGQPEATAAVNSNADANSLNLVTNTPQSQPLASNQTSQTQVIATETIIRPTQIVFPTDTPTLAVTATPEASGTETTTVAVNNNAAATCTLVVDYNLNLRSLPTTEGSTVYVSIPFGTTVTSNGRTTDGWYRVSYNGQEGWVNNAYVTTTASCASLPTVTAS